LISLRSQGGKNLRVRIRHEAEGGAQGLRIWEALSSILGLAINTKHDLRPRCDCSYPSPSLYSLSCPYPPLKTKKRAADPRTTLPDCSRTPARCTWQPYCRSDSGWECSASWGRIADSMLTANRVVISFDLVYWGYTGKLRSLTCSDATANSIVLHKVVVGHHAAVRAARAEKHDTATTAWCSVLHAPCSIRFACDHAEGYSGERNEHDYIWLRDWCMMSDLIASCLASALRSYRHVPSPTTDGNLPRLRMRAAQWDSPSVLSRS